MFKNVASQKITFLVIDTATNLPKTGDAANLTAYVSIDDGAVTALTDTSATELSSTNAPGLYTFDCTQAETNGDKLVFSGKSSTSGVRVVPVMVYTLPASFTSLNVSNVNTLASHDPGATLGTSTLTQAQVTGGAYALNSASFAFNAALDFTTTQKSATIARVTLTDTVTTYTGNTPQTGDAYARIGANGAGLTSLAPAATALSTATWTATLAGYLANLNTGGVVASQADVNALNQSASRRVTLVTVPQYERPEASSSTYTIEARTYDGDGAAVNADTTPTLTATGVVSGSLAANLSAATNTATGVYRWTYTVATGATEEQIRFDLSATISSSAFTMSTYSQVVDEVSQTWTATNAIQLAAIYNKLPSKTYLVGTNNSDGDVQLDEATGTPANSAGVTTLIATIGSPVNATISADIAAVKTDTGTLTSRITSTLFSGITRLSRWLGALAGKTADSTTLAEIQATTAGAGYSNLTDSLEAIRDRGDAGGFAGSGGGGGGGTGSGPIEITITVTDGTDPLENASVRLLEGVNDLSGDTDASGEIVFGATAATWRVLIFKDGYQFDPVDLVVTVNDSVTYAMTPRTLTPNASPDLSNVVITCLNSSGTATAGIVVQVRLTIAPPKLGGSSLDGDWESHTSDGDGEIALTLLAYGTYEIRRGTNGIIQKFVPNAGAFTVPSFVGRT